MGKYSLVYHSLIVCFITYMSSLGGYRNANGANQLVQPQARQSLKYDKKTHAKRRGLLLPVFVSKFGDLRLR